MNSPRVLHVTTFLQGGAGRNITDLAVAQHHAGCDVLVVADAGGEPGYSSYPEYVEELRDEGVPFARVSSTFKRDTALNARAAGELRALTEDWRPHVVHAHAATPALVARLAGLTDGAGVLQTMHGWGISKTIDQQRLDIALLEEAAIVTVPSAAASRTLRDAGLRRDDVRVIPYGIPLDGPDDVPDAADADHVRRRAAGRAVCLCIGTIGERKNQRLLVEALAHEALRDAIAVFIGDGAAGPLLARARELGVADRVVLLGHRPRASRYLTLAHALVLPSLNEGLPFAVLEALRAGVPVAASDTPEMAEALEDGGCLFACDDAEALASAVRTAFAAPDDLRARLRTRFAERYSSGRMFKEYSSVYETLVFSTQRT
jgi:glycosyltransferase involved in cell wall biosynthesis